MATIDRPLLSTDLDGIFRPSSVAIYGISDRTSLRIAENMTVAGVPFYGINPTREEACGIRCYPSIGDCPAVPEMVVMGVGHGRIEDAIGDVLSVDGVRAVITPGLGNEAGPEGPPVSARVSERVRDAGIAMVGPELHGRGHAGRAVALDRHADRALHRRPGRDAGALRLDRRDPGLARPADRIPHRRLRRKRDRHRRRRHDRVLRGGSAVPGGRPVPGDRAPAGGVRGGAAADRRGRQGRRRAQGRHVRDGRPRGARAHRRAGRLRPVVLGDAAVLQRDPLRRLRHLAGAPRGVLARHAAPRPADRRRHQLGRRGRVLRRQGRAGGDPAAAAVGRAVRQDQAGVPELHRRRQPGRLLGDRRRPRRLPPRVPADGRVRRVRRAGVGHRPLELADRRRAASWRRTSPTTCAPPATAPTSSRA